MIAPPPSTSRFNAPAFAAAVSDAMADVQAKKLAEFQQILDANERGDRADIVRIVTKMMEDERCCA